ncbi:MAG: hypothetical protein Q8O41_09990, partial [Candidatus Methanoperedens sp.]|nr:hypothetical protein [Candidatus Methanoperedens sp.]
MSSRLLRQEFPHLGEWCDDHLWAPGCYHGSVGQGWEVVEKYISKIYSVTPVFLKSAPPPVIFYENECSFCLKLE